MYILPDPLIISSATTLYHSPLPRAHARAKMLAGQ